MSAIVASAEGAILTILLQPKASCTEYVGVHGASLKFRVTASPIKGAANTALCRYLAERVGLPYQDVIIRSGPASRTKRVLLRGVSEDRVRKVFQLPPRR